ncbi:hypothetical protein V1504DRAFT_432768 [Lipomyces starkeyi]
MTPSSSSDLPQFASASQTSFIEAAFNKFRVTSPSDSSGATTEASVPKALLAAHDGAFMAAMRHASDWHIPEASRVPFSEIPEILISLFGTFRPVRYRRMIMPSARRGCFTRHAPFEVFAVKWSGEEIRPDGTIDIHDHDRESNGEGDPVSRNTSGSSGSTGSDDSEHDRPGSDDHTQRKRVAPITKTVTKHLPAQHAHKHNGPLTPRHKQHNPSANTFRSLIKIATRFAAALHCAGGMGSEGAATGSPVKIYQAGGGQGRIWYWIVGRLVGHDVLVGVSTFAVFGTYDGDAGDNDGTNEGGQKMVVTAFNDSC